MGLNFRMCLPESGDVWFVDNAFKVLEGTMDDMFHIYGWNCHRRTVTTWTSRCCAESLETVGKLAQV